MNWENILKIKVRENLTPEMERDIDYVVSRLMNEPTLVEKIMKILTLEEEE
tara:strand:+ start:1161 stop:1313 length:153 start_codon:yes stop_codon:yes gene_type:complete